MICSKCNKEHSGSFGSGKFCSRSCANSRIRTDEIKRKIKETLLLTNKKVGRKKIEHLLNCEKCKKEFVKYGYYRKNRSIRCNNCKNKRFAKKDPKSIFELSSRTISKIFKRANAKCSMCGWNKTSLDLHHIIHRKNGGTNEHDNLISLCPNCHRMAHENQYSIEQLKEKNLTVTLKNWIHYYNVG